MVPSKTRLRIIVPVATILLIAAAYMYYTQEPTFEGYWTGYFIVPSDQEDQHYPIILQIWQEKKNFKGILTLRETPSNFVVDTLFDTSLSVKGDKVNFEGRSQETKAQLSFEGRKGAGKIYGAMRVITQDFFFDVQVREGNMVLSK